MKRFSFFKSKPTAKFFIKRNIFSKVKRCCWFYSHFYCLFRILLLVKNRKRKQIVRIDVVQFVAQIASNVNSTIKINRIAFQLRTPIAVLIVSIVRICIARQEPLVGLRFQPGPNATVSFKFTLSVTSHKYLNNYKLGRGSNPGTNTGVSFKVNLNLK